MTEYINKTVRTLRQNATPAEQKFWQIVRNRKIGGFRFFRQHPIEFEIDGQKRFFVADFYCKQQKLVIELDGSIHVQQREYDCYRSLIIEKCGIKIVRFTNEEVRYEIENVVKRLKDNLTL
ncbi:endonuclease domain-containing protein [Candidatus Latescibacterota bacterium]